MAYPPITSVHLNLTHRCNLACRYCYVAQEPMDMPWEVARDSMDFLAKNAALSKRRPEICFFGGEPLLRWDDIIVPAVEYINKAHPKAGFTYQITTNGTLLTEDKIDFIKKNNINVMVSIDGCASTQNYNRPFHNGNGSHEVVEKHIKALLAAGFTPTFRATIIPATCGNAFSDYLYAIRLGYKTMFALADSFSEWDAKSEKMLEIAYKNIAQHFIAHWKRYRKNPIRLSLLERSMKQYLQDTENISRGRATKRVPTSACSKCGLGQSAGAAISPTGDIYGCQEMTSNEGEESIFYIGNIYDGTKDELRDRLRREYDNNPITGDMDCNECEAMTVCNGGCVANNYLDTGCLSRRTHGACFYQRLLYRTAKRIVDELKDVPGFRTSLRERQAATRRGGNCRNCDTCQVCDTCQNCDVCQNHDS
mgnify:FL=1